MNEFEIDDTAVRKMFAELTAKDRKKVFRRAITNALNIVKRETINNLKGVIEPDKIDFKDLYGLSFKKGIKTKVYRNNQSGIIHILGNYKLKFFELGTKKRFAKKRNGKPLKKARSTGSIPAYHFFKKAKQAKEQEVFNSIEKLLAKSIEKINLKYK